MDLSKPVPPLRQLDDLDSTVKVFHEENSNLESDLAFVTALERIEGSGRGFPSYETLVFVLNDYLRKAYGMVRVLGRARGAEEEDPVLNAFTPVLRDRWTDVMRLNNSRVWEVAKDGRLQGEIEFVFEQLLIGMRLEPKKPGQARPRSPVAVAKLLAVLAPNLCIIWDQRYVMKRGLLRASADPTERPWYPRGDGLGYAQYIAEKGRQFAALASSLHTSEEQLSDRVVTAHAAKLAPLRPEMASIRPEPLTKILDELNFWPG